MVQQWDEIGDVNKAAKALDVLEIYQKIFDAVLANVPPRSYKVWSELAQAVDDFSAKCGVQVNSKLREPEPVIELISLDVFSVSYESLKACLAVLLERLVAILKKNLPSGEAGRILHSQVIPIMKRDYKRIDVYGLNRVLVSLL